jgi:hypothetical protein
LLSGSQRRDPDFREMAGDEIERFRREMRFEHASDVGSRVEKRKCVPFAGDLHGRDATFARRASTQIKFEDIAFSSLSEGWGFVMFSA